MKIEKVKSPYLQVEESNAKFKCFVSVQKSSLSEIMSVQFVDIVTSDDITQSTYEYKQGKFGVDLSELNNYSGKFENLLESNCYFVQIEKEEELYFLLSLIKPKSFEILTQYSEAFSELLFEFSAPKVGSDFVMGYFSRDLSDMLLFESCYINVISDVVHKLHFWDDVVEGTEMTRPVVSGHQWSNNSVEDMKMLYIKESKTKILDFLNQK